MANPDGTFKVLVADWMALLPGADGKPDPSPFRDYVTSAGGRLHLGSCAQVQDLERDRVHFFYRPELSREAELLADAADGRYDAVIAAATIIPPGARFARGGVRIGAGTGNMLSHSWGGRDGRGGEAPLMNTPGVNSRATAQMVMKAVLQRRPDLPFGTLHDLVIHGRFDTGRDLYDWSTAKLEGQVMAVLGYGNIGREVARLAAAFGMTVRVHARPSHRDWIESEGFTFAASSVDAARGADVLSVHLGLGPIDPSRGRPANAGFIGAAILNELADGATVVNFDRGEVVDVDALDRAMHCGTVAHVAVDADIFLDETGAAALGPLTPYLPLATRYPERVLLLPHAVADTDHPSRVAGAKIAVDLILDVLRERRVRNLVGDLPAGYVDAGTIRCQDVGAVRPNNLRVLCDDQSALRDLAAHARTVAEFYDALAGTKPTDTQRLLDGEEPARAVAASNRLTAGLRRHGLLGPYRPV